MNIKDIIWKIKFYRANAYKAAEMMSTKFYHCGSNVQLYTKSFGTEPYLISIGNNVTCASNVRFINHDVSCFNIARYLGLPEGSLDKVGPITLHDNCFIGAETMLMPGCSVGRNSVIAARSVVTKQVPDNEVWGGVPAHYIMNVAEYAERIKIKACEYPWVDKDTAHKKRISEDELIKARQKFFFENIY